MYNVSNPVFELSYETISHKKIPLSYDICFAIPISKKYIISFTKSEGQNICILMELNRFKKVSVSSDITTTNVMQNIYSGTIFFGSIITSNDNHSFIIEDVLMFQGISQRNTVFGVKIGIIEQFLDLQGITMFDKHDEQYSNEILNFFLPVFWKSHVEQEINSVPSTISYPLHHIQYRSLKNIVPYLNVFLNNRGMFPWNENTSNIEQTLIKNDCFVTPQKLSKTVYTKCNSNLFNLGKCTFIVIADSQNDIYFLFACSTSKQPIYYDVAYIPNYKNSVYMNSLFRNIKENKNLDYIEESDDEDDFEDVRENKYVDLNKKIFMECVYHTKFRKWVPIKVNNSNDINLIVSIDKLQTISE